MICTYRVGGSGEMSGLGNAFESMDPKIFRFVIILDLVGVKAVLIMSHCYRRDAAVAVDGVRYTLHIYCPRVLHSLPLYSHEPNVLPIRMTFGIIEI